MNKIIIKNLDDLMFFANDFAKDLKPFDKVLLNGDLGAGKTQFVKFIGKYLGVSEEITSPTFTILKTYKTKNNLIKTINHFDLYRIKNIDELYNIGFVDYLNVDNSICIIEWPELAYELIDFNYYDFNIKKIIEPNVDITSDMSDKLCREITYIKK